MPREGSREVDEGIIISVPPDVCLTPCGSGMVPVPYKIWARQRDAANLANTVRQTSLRTHVKESLVLHCYGDEPGTGGGVVSKTTGAECTPKTWSTSVRAEGRNVARHDDQWWMNHKNTWGVLTYIKSLNTTSQDVPGPVTADMSSNASLYQVSDNGSDTGGSQPAAAGTQYAQEFFFPEEIIPFLRTLPEEEPPPIVRPMPRIAPRPAPEPGEEEAPNPNPNPNPGPRPKPPPGPGFRTQGRCRAITICFESNGKDAEYMRQLGFQQDALNAKSACQAKADIDNFDSKTPAQKAAQRALANKAKGPFIANWLATHPGQSTTGMDALHRLDMVAGGNPTDFADMGDSSVNQSIGPEWNADSRKGELKRYAQDMCDKKCRMAVTLDLCNGPQAPMLSPLYA
ncbi:MAG: PAAR-like domain-containing protein [Pseudomonadota bacterium]